MNEKDNDIIISGGNRNFLYPNEQEAFREVQKVLKDYGVNSGLTVRPFTKPKYYAIFLDDKNDGYHRQFCWIKIGTNTLNLLRIKNENETENKFSEKITLPSDISSDRIKNKLKGLLKEFGYIKINKGEQK